MIDSLLRLGHLGTPGIELLGYGYTLLVCLSVLMLSTWSAQFFFRAYSRVVALVGPVLMALLENTYGGGWFGHEVGELRERLPLLYRTRELISWIYWFPIAGEEAMFCSLLCLGAGMLFSLDNLRSSGPWRRMYGIVGLSLFLHVALSQLRDVVRFLDTIAERWPGCGI